MKYHPFPQTDLSVSQLCFGCWGITSDFHWGDRVEDESVQAMWAAVDAGINFFDTAPVYGDGESELLLGKFLAKNHLREKIVIASKVRPDKMRPDQIQQECENHCNVCKPTTWICIKLTGPILMSRSPTAGTRCES